MQVCQSISQSGGFFYFVFFNLSFMLWFHVSASVCFHSRERKEEERGTVSLPSLLVVMFPLSPSLSHSAVILESTDTTKTAFRFSQTYLHLKTGLKTIPHDEEQYRRKED